MQPDINHYRKSIRFKEYDYSQPGDYFVTICTYNRECLMGEIEDGKVHLNDVGRIADIFWQDIPKHFSNVILDEYVIMPNHVHGIITITERRDVQLNVPTKGFSPKKGTLSVIIRTYKAAVTTECRHNHIYDFKWQQRFYDRIIRNEKELHNIRDYIAANDLEWSLDSNNPQNNHF
jgi:putative transposase